MRWPQGLAYGQVIKSTTEKSSDGIHLKVIRGKAKLLHTLSLLGYEKINTSSIERQNGTSRLHNQRKVRKTLAFSKSHLYHGWMSWLSVVQYNFCRAHGSLRIKDERGIHHRTPAMAAGLTNRILLTREWLLSPILGGKDHHRTRPEIRCNVKILIDLNTRHYCIIYFAFVAVISVMSTLFT